MPKITQVTTITEITNTTTFVVINNGLTRRYSYKDLADKVSTGGGVGLSSRSKVSVTSANLVSHRSGNYEITGFKGYALLSIQTSAAAWVVVYSSTSARTADSSRPITSDPNPGSGVIAEVITTSGTTQYFSPSLIGYSSETIPSTSIPIKIYNNGSRSAAITVTLTLIQLEA